MEEILPELVARWNAGEAVALATVVSTFRSSPRLPGASMLVSTDGAVVGSVSGGCVEGAVYELAREVLATGTTALQRYGVSDDDVISIGLTCGGILDVFVQRVSRESFPELDHVVRDVEAGRPVAVATVIEHPDPNRVGRRIVVPPHDSTSAAPDVEGTFGGQAMDCAIAEDVSGLLSVGRTTTLAYGPEGERLGEGMRVFVWAFAPPPRMVVFGAIDFAAAMARAGKLLGYHVTVCDARPLFATASRFPAADEVVVQWPHKYLLDESDAGRVDSRTALCVLTHDPKFDVPLLEVALTLPEVGYIGAMGSRRTHEDRMTRLREVGLAEEDFARLRSPIGLDLGARTPEETAVSIAGEIIASRCGGSGRPLSALRGRIHTV